MTDLRDQPAIDAARDKAKAIFLEYHNNSPWAEARMSVTRVLDALVLNKEGLAYMERENEETRRRRAKFEADNIAFEAQRRKDAGLPPEKSDAKSP